MKNNKKTLDWDLQLPNFADPGVLLRVAVLANVCMLVGAILKQDSGWTPVETFMSSAAVGEPALLLSISILSLLWPRSSPRVRSLLGLFVGVFSVGVISWIQIGWTSGRFFSAIANSMVLSITLSLYFDWRYRRLSPALAEAKLDALVSRMRPHFLFNAINGIVMLLSKSPTDAEEALLDLADVFRALLKEGNAMAKLSEEVDLTEKYLRIEKMRFRDRMQVNFNIEPNALNVMIPTMLLQPLAENAVIHGIESVGEGAIDISAFIKDRRLTIVIENPYGVSSEKKRLRLSNGIAMDNIKQRLNLLYDIEAKFSFGPKSSGIWRMSLHLPAHYELEDKARS